MYKINQLMTTFNQPSILKKIFILVLALSFSSVTFSQDDDNLKQKKEKKAKSSFKVSAGVNLNDLSLDSANGIESKVGVGYNLGLSYKRGRFFYYEIGVRYNNRSFDFNDPINQEKSSLKLSAIDIPLTGGINITSFADRLVGVRVFVSAIPSFTLNKNVDKIFLVEDDISDFVFYGQAGVGVDILFFFIEAGFNYGFSDIVNNIENQSFNSIPSQGFFNLGFRF